MTKFYLQSGKGCNSCYEFIKIFTPKSLIKKYPFEVSISLIHVCDISLLLWTYIITDRIAIIITIVATHIPLFVIVRKNSVLSNNHTYLVYV